MIESCHREVVELHAFFSSWFEGRVVNDDETFARVARVLADDFVYIGVDGSVRGREEVLGSIRAHHGAHAADGHGLRIYIRHFEGRWSSAGVALTTYEEQQFVDGVPNARLSTAIFRRSENAPEGVLWFHLHEVGLPPA